MNSQEFQVTFKLQRMRKFCAREILWMTLPVLLLGGVGWRTFLPVEERAPEDVTQGQPRAVVGKWRAVPLSAFDVYRGYGAKYEVSLWSAGRFAPLVPTIGVRGISLSREIQFQYPTPNVVYRRGAKWCALPSTDETPSVEFEFSPESQTLGERLAVPLLVRLPPDPNVNEVRLRGRLHLMVYDREQSRLPSGAITDDIIGEHPLISPPVDFAVSMAEVKRLNPQVARVSPLRLVSVGRPRFPTDGDAQLSISAVCDSSFPLQAPFTVHLDGGRLLNSEGREVAHCVSYGSGLNDGTATVEPAFSPHSSAVKGLVFQGALSVNGCWPLQINVRLPALHAPPTQSPVLSSLPFRR